MEFLSFFHDVVDFLNRFLSHPLLFKIVIFFIILFLAHLGKTYLTRLILKIFQTFNLNHAPSTEVLEEMLPNFIVLIALNVATERLEFPGKIGFLLENTCKSIVIVYFFNVVLRLTPILIKSFITSKNVTVEWCIKLLRGFIVFVCATCVLESWGIKVGPIITGFGLFGAAVAFASKDLFENIISGAILIAENKFKQGDHIKIDDSNEGIVDVIRLRSTKLVRLDGVPIYVPNSKLASNSVINYSMRPNREICWTISVTYDTKVEDLRQIRDQINDYVRTSDDFSHDMPKRTVVRVNEFADSSIDILVMCFTTSAEWLEWLAAKERLAYKIMDIIEKNNSSMAYPSYSMYIEKMPEIQIKEKSKNEIVKNENVENPKKELDR